MKKWNLIVDVANCTNCNVCALAVQDEHVGNEFPGYAAEMPKHGHRWIEIKRRERAAPPVTDVAYLPTMCQHCDDAPCIAAAKDGRWRAGGSDFQKLYRGIKPRGLCPARSGKRNCPASPAPDIKVCLSVLKLDRLKGGFVKRRMHGLLQTGPVLGPRTP